MKRKKNQNSEAERSGGEQEMVAQSSRLPPSSEGRKIEK